MINKIEQLFQNSWNEEIRGEVCVGLSGGVDSVVLLHLLVAIASERNLKISAMHINHNISPNAHSWAEFSYKLCNNLGIPLEIVNVEVKRSGGESLENNARILRYKSLCQNDAPIIALAHHQNDQVETVLGQILRGSDVHNVGAMKEFSYKSKKLFWRPLLNITRTEIEEFAGHNNLKYITDESNNDVSYLRNFIRHNVLPILSKWDGHINAKILNFNHQLQHLLSITDEIAVTDLQAIVDNQNQILLDKFSVFSRDRQINILTQYIYRQGLSLPSQKQIIEFIRQAITSSFDSKPSLKLSQNMTLIKFKNCIYIS